jgi:hypothetical protein
MEPFQIFSLHQRPQLAVDNPGLSNSRLTSVLSQMWRSLTPGEKQEYVDVAVSHVMSKGRLGKLPRARRAKLLVPPPFQELRPDFGRLPEFAIIPRGSFGASAADASEHALSGQKTAHDWGDDFSFIPISGVVEK